MDLVQIVPRLPPAICGLGDYAFALAAQLRSAHAIRSRFVVTEPQQSRAVVPPAPPLLWPAKPRGRELDGFPIHALSERKPDELAATLSTLAGEIGIVLLHYVNYAYARKGCPFWLVRGLERWRRGDERRRLIVMFHELYATGPLWTSAGLTSALQWRLAARLAQVSDACRTNRQATALKLEQMAPRHAGRIEVFPVFSNFGEPELLQPISSRIPQAVIYGDMSDGENDPLQAGRILQRVCRYLGVEKAICFGKEQSNFQIEDMPTERRSAISKEEARALLLNSRAGIVSYSQEELGKSGIFAAYCAHRLVPVVFSAACSPADGLRAGEHFLLASTLDQPLSLEQQEAIARTAHGWYQNHNLTRTADSLARSIASLSKLRAQQIPAEIQAAFRATEA